LFPFSSSRLKATAKYIVSSDCWISFRHSHWLVFQPAKLVRDTVARFEPLL
jgi:hypothetical protein